MSGKSETSHYKKAGVDIEAGDQLVDWLVSSQPQKWPHQERIVAGIGGFASLFRADFQSMKKPCLVSSTDGVGTKVKLAAQFDQYGSVAQDLVGMCVNDLLCTGAQPLFFLDYYATGRLELKRAQDFLQGLRKACIESESALLGGETAEMPGVYQNNDFDVAGFAVGVVDEEKAWGAHRVRTGDRIIAVASSGFHSNGYSLLRRVFEKDLAEWKDELLIPTALYSRVVTTLRTLPEIHAAAHITGGGLDNLLRVFPQNTAAQLNPWDIPRGFREVQKRTQMTWAEMLKTLNCGIGFVFVVEASGAKTILEKIKGAGSKAWDMGEVIKHSGEPVWNLDTSGWSQA